MEIDWDGDIKFSSTLIFSSSLKYKARAKTRKFSISLMEEKSAAVVTSSNEKIKVIRASILGLVITIFIGYIFMWIMMPTSTYRLHFYPKIKAHTNSTFFGKQGTVVLWKTSYSSSHVLYTYVFYVSMFLQVQQFLCIHFQCCSYLFWALYIFTWDWIISLVIAIRWKGMYA